MAALSETTIFMAHPDDPNKTLLTVDCNMTIHSTSWIIPKLEGIVIKVTPWPPCIQHGFCLTLLPLVDLR
jgi:hypothetical protein